MFQFSSSIEQLSKEIFITHYLFIDWLMEYFSLEGLEVDVDILLRANLAFGNSVSISSLLC